jgi:TolB-like protein
MTARSVVLLLSLYLLAAPRLNAQCPDGSPPPCRAQTVRAAAAPAPNSVAVLYFDNLSRDTADLYLADGLTEELIDRLGRIERLVVRSRTTVQRFRSRRLEDPAALGRTLAVTHLVSGSVRRSGGRLRITAELTRAATGVRVWGETYERPVDDLLRVEVDIAQAIAAGVGGRLAPADHRSLVVTPTSSSKAYDHFLRGNFLLAQRTQPAITGALREYDAALRLDPGFSRAAARLAYTYALALGWGYQIAGIPRDSIMSRGLWVAADVIRRDPDNSDAWMARGYLLKFLDPQSYAGSKDALHKAVVLDGRNAEAWHQYGSVLYDLGEDSASVAAFRQALVIEPDREITLIEASYVLLVARRWKEALQLLDSAVVVAPASANAWAWLLEARLLSGDTARARRDAGVVGQLLSDDPLPQLFAARLAAGARDTVAMRARRGWLVTWTDTMDVNEWGPGYVAPFIVAALLALGERERALRVLESLQPRNPSLGFWLRWPTCDPLRGDPRFQRLVEESRPR